MRIDSTGQWQELPAGQVPGQTHSGHPGGGWEPVPPPPAPPKKAWWRRWTWKHIVLSALALFMLTIAWLAITAPLSKSLQPIAAPSLTLLSAEGEPIARRGAVVEAPVKVAQLPKQVVQPFIAIEDRRFYSHLGVDPQGLARALAANLRSGGVV